MAVTQQRPRVTGAARRTAPVVALLALVSTWSGTTVSVVAVVTPDHPRVDLDAFAAVRERPPGGRRPGDA